MFESHIITLIESYSAFPLLQMVQCRFNIKKHEVSTYWQKKTISLWVKKDKENDTGQMEHLFLMNKKHLSPSIAHSFCAKSN